MADPPTLGRTIRLRRIELGLTQAQLAERIGGGVRQTEVSRLECDRVTLPRRERLGRIAAALDLPLGDLLARSGWTGADACFAPTVPAESAPLPAAPETGRTPMPVVTRTCVDPIPLRTRLRDALERSQQLREESNALRRRIDEVYRRGFARDRVEADRRRHG